MIVEGKGRLYGVAMIGLVILVLVGLGFLVNVASPIGTKNYAMPDIPTIPPHCPDLCDLNMSYHGCNITACDYHYCKVWWYSFCAVE